MWYHQVYKHYTEHIWSQATASSCHSNPPSPHTPFFSLQKKLHDSEALECKTNLDFFFSLMRISLRHRALKACVTLLPAQHHSSNIVFVLATKKNNAQFGAAPPPPRRGSFRVCGAQLGYVTTNRRVNIVVTLFFFWQRLQRAAFERRHPSNKNQKPKRTTQNNINSWLKLKK